MLKINVIEVPVPNESFRTVEDKGINEDLREREFKIVFGDIVTKHRIRRSITDERTPEEVEEILKRQLFDLIELNLCNGLHLGTRDWEDEKAYEIKGD